MREKLQNNISGSCDSLIKKSLIQDSLIFQQKPTSIQDTSSNRLLAIFAINTDSKQLWLKKGQMKLIMVEDKEQQSKDSRTCRLKMGPILMLTYLTSKTRPWRKKEKKDMNWSNGCIELAKKFLTSSGQRTLMSNFNGSSKRNSKSYQKSMQIEAQMYKQHKQRTYSIDRSSLKT